MPGGVLELDETLAEGVRREVQEECGIEVNVGPVVGVFEPILRDAEGRLRFHYVVIDYLARHISGDPRPADDADDAQWIDIAALDGLPMHPETREIIRRGQALSRGGYP